MSNTIAVKINKRIDYCVFRWVDKQLQAFYHNEWHNVTKTTKRTQYGDRIFAA